jgi:hypothetical protein
VIFLNGLSGARRIRHQIRPAGLVLAVAIVAIATCLPGCSSGVIFNAGPLGGEESGGINCAPVIGRHGVLSYGSIEFANSSSTPVVIDKVSLADPRGLRMLAAYIVPITGDNLYGLRPGYPPARGLPRGVQWSERQTADGAKLGHERGHVVSNLVAVLKPTRNPGWARGINIYYHSPDGQRYLLRQGLQVLVGINSCPEDLAHYIRK